MNELNSSLLEGCLVRDAELRHTPKGRPVCNFVVENRRFFKVGDNIDKEVSFFTIETWDSLAERVGHIGKKGRGIRAVGVLKQYRWNDAGGKPHSKICFRAEHVEFRPGVDRSDLPEEYAKEEIESFDAEESAEEPDLGEGPVLEETEDSNEQNG